MRQSGGGCSLLIVNLLSGTGSPIIFGDQIMQNLNLIFDATIPGSESVMIGVSNWALE
jgi:hypothetical protein